MEMIMHLFLDMHDFVKYPLPCTVHGFHLISFDYCKTQCLTLVCSFSVYLDECTQTAADLGLKGPGYVAKSVVARIIRSGRAALCLQSFYTAGPKEVRAWTIQTGTLAPQAAGVIHSDFERGFIKAEVANFDDFKALHAGAASMAKIKDAGKYRQEGKTYTFQDGDIVVFMHNANKIKK